MSPTMKQQMPLTREELIQLKHELKPYDYKLVELGQIRILVIRSVKEFPDIVNDLEVMINKFDLRDTSSLDHACIIGDAEVVGVSPEAINSIINRRIEDDEKIAEDLAEKLTEPYTTLTFEHEDDPLKILRLGIRVKGNIKEFKPQQLSEILFSHIKSLPRNSEVIYLIADDGYIRISGKEFYHRLHEFLSENPNMNKELASEFIDIARDKLADHFIGSELKGIKNGIMKPSKQEPINKFVKVEAPDLEEKSAPEHEPESKSEIQIKKEEHEYLVKPDEVSKKVEQKNELIKSTSLADDLIEQDSDIPTKTEESKPAEQAPALVESSSKWPTVSNFLDTLTEKLKNTGFKVIDNVQIPGVDLVANDPESFIRHLFFCYMPTFDFKKAMDLERALDRFSPDICIIVGSKEDTDLKLFIVGKNIKLLNIDTLINSDYLIHLEEHL